MELFSYNGLHTAYVFVFSLGLGLGLGAAVLGSAFFFSASDDGRVSRDEFRMLRIARMFVWVALLLYGFGGLGLFTLAYESMLALDIFYASMSIVAILTVNELFFSLFHVPHLRNESRDRGGKSDAYFLIGSAISVASWVFLALHHAIYRADVEYFLFMGAYVSVVFLGILVAFFARKGVLKKTGKKTLGIAAAIVFVMILSLGAAAWTAPKGISALPESKESPVSPVAAAPASGTSTGSGATYTVDDVALHNNPEDCWLIIDDKVFNATEASRLHPAMFNCGQNASQNYHKNHGEGIRDKMMKFYIGNLSGATGVTNVDFSFEKNDQLKPYRELYVKEGSWNPRELMLVVEKDAEKLLAIDGTTHKEIGRVHDVGFQPHTSVYSSDAKFMYIISRDGWLTKINLETLEPVVSVSVGKNSRGTAITDNDKYVAVGNYEPGNLLIIDAVSMEILKEIPLVGEMNGKKIESRAGAVLEDGNRIIVALKDLNSVWAIDTDQKDFPVTNKFSDIGNNVPALHDAFLTPNGGHYIVSSQGSKTAWVLDLETMKPIAEIETGETPHTGPGAAWGKFIYVPALGEGLITVIDTTTWKVAKHIKTGGPGLFVRSYSKDSSYPYVWADTAFGDHKDEIYVIDARINEIVKTIVPVKGESSWHPEFTYDGKFVYVVSQSANEVEVYDANTFEIVKRIPSETPSAISNIGIRIEEPGL